MNKFILYYENTRYRKKNAICCSRKRIVKKSYFCYWQTTETDAIMKVHRTRVVNRKEKLKKVLKKCWQCRTRMILYQSCVKQETQKWSNTEARTARRKHCSLSAVAQSPFAQQLLRKRAFKSCRTKFDLACTLTNKQQCNPENSRTEFMELKEISEERNHKSKSRKNLKESFQGRKRKAKFNLGKGQLFIESLILAQDERWRRA